jgi:hypothetical protein
MKCPIVRVSTFDGGFVDLPSVLREATTPNVHVYARRPHADDATLPADCLLLRGTLLQQTPSRSIYSCGGLFLSIAGAGAAESEVEFVVVSSECATRASLG